MSKILDKIRKLLALATSPNEHEARLAMENAQQLMQEHGIEQAQIDAAQDHKEAVKIETVSTGQTSGSGAAAHAWRVKLAQAVAQACFCEVYADTPKKLLFFAGRATDIAVAAVLFEWLRRELQRLCDEEGRFKSRDWRESFLMGAATRIDERLQEQRKQAEASSTAIVLYKDAVKEAFGRFAQQHGLVVRGVRLRGSSDAHDIGYDAANRADINAPARRLK